MSVNHVDALLSKLGTGKWNVLHILACGCASGLPAVHTLSGVFVVPRLQHTCHVPDDVAVVEASGNSTDINPCSYFVRSEDSSVEEVPCSNWVYDNSTFTRTITSEFDVVCEKEHIRALYMSLYMIGVFCSSPIYGYISDRFGRKKTFIAGLLVFTFLSFLAGWLPNIPAVLACRFLIGLTHVPVVKISYIIGMETCTPEARPPLGLLLYLPWTLNVMIYSGMAYMIRDWRILSTVASVQSLVLFPAIFFMDESPHWLAVRGKYAEALKVLKKVARWNKSELPADEEVVTLLKSSTVKVPSVTSKRVGKDNMLEIVRRQISNLFILFRTPRLRIISLVMHLNFFVTDLLYYGLAYSGGSFSIDIFSYMALLALLEFPGRGLMYPIIKRFGRKDPMVAAMFITGFLLILIGVVPSDQQGLIVGLAMLGRMCITCAGCLTYLFGSELFPTEVRTRGISNSFMMSRLGSAIAPFITEYLGYKYQWGPPVVFGAAAVVSGLASTVLWDTTNKPLPDTIEFLESEHHEVPWWKRVAKFGKKEEQHEVEAPAVGAEEVPLNANQ